MKEKEQKQAKTKPAKTAKPEKPGKAPGALKKPIKKKIFEKKFIKYLEHSGDRKFFIDSFEQQDDTFILRQGLRGDETKKLKALVKVIKKNRKGGVKVVKLGIAAALIAAVVIFFVVFANPLLGRALEKGLEAVFQAKSDVYNFRLSLIDFTFSIREITVANRDMPMKNLFQMGAIKISFKPAALLRGKIYIEEVSAASIRFGTDRTVSGALPARPPKVKKEKPKSDAPPLIDFKNFDAMALLDREFEKLSTPKLYDEAVAAYNTTLEKWQTQTDLVKTRGEELQNAAQPLLSINVNNYRDVESLKTIPQTIKDIETMVTTIQTAADDAAKMVTGIEADIKLAQGLEQSARTGITGDINYLKSFIDPGSGAAFAALEPSIREILSGAAEQYLDYGLMALEVLDRLRSESAAKPKTEKPKKEPKVAFTGRDVHFPQRAYPQFYLGDLHSDITVGSWNGAFQVRHISSNPDITDEPVMMNISAAEVAGSLNRQITFNGSADFRTAAAERYNGTVEGSGFPVALGDQLKQAGISGFSGNTDFSLNMSGRTDGGAAGGGTVRISRAQVIDPAGTIAEAVASAVREAGNINLGIQYTHHIEGNDEFKLTTNIAELVNKAVRAIASAYINKAMDDLEAALRARVDQYIDGKFLAKEDLDALLRFARGDKAAVDQLKNSLNNKKAEFEQKLKTAADQAVQQAKDEVKQQGQQAVQDVLQGKTPTLQAPTLPSLPGGIKLPGR